ncbi:MAG: winged helix-turn-helix domain-containing protein [Candidatus Dormibacteraeota bacterium]|nr:winged helix-turn-helix domain-containing protein [Candidatus Dormibacteraeota bacterium]
MEFSLLGPLVVRRGSAEVPVAGERARRALALLALSPGRPVAVDRLVEEVWESPPEGAANALQSLVSRLRRTLGTDAPIEREGDTYRLAVAPQTVDAWRFERALMAARAGEAGALDRALDEWHGQPLLGLGERGAIAAERLRLQDLHRTALRMRAAVRLDAGGDPTLAGDLQVLCAANPLDEELHALLLRALVAAGREAEALTRYEDLRQRLRDELGADPAPALQDLHRAILRHDPAVRPRPRKREGPTNLRRPLTSFIGRDEDRRRLTERLRGHRLVTIVGTGGAGKTRLAQEVAARLRGEFDGGVWLVELAAVREEGEVARAILSTLAPHVGTVAEVLQSLAPDPVLGLVAALEDRRLLLLLDNCEQVAGSCAEIAEALAGGTPGVAVLVTSREPLGVPGEVLWPVGPLGGEGEGADAAVRLFADRAQAVDPGFRLDEETRPLVERICVDLDRLPLAIELAAARLRTLTLREIADRLADRFRLLGTGPRRAGERHQTLRAVVDWSWDLLLPVEQTLLRRLAVFAGGCDVEAVEQTCAGLGGAGDLPPDQALEVLSALVDRSLVVREERGGRTFYRLLETVRAYALERLRESGEQEASGSLKPPGAAAWPSPPHPICAGRSSGGGWTGWMRWKASCGARSSGRSEPAGRSRRCDWAPPSAGTWGCEDCATGTTSGSGRRFSCRAKSLRCCGRMR